MVLSSELLAESPDLPDQSEAQSMARSLHRSAIWLQTLVDNLICEATICGGRFRVIPTSILLEDVVAEIRPVIEPLLTSKQQRLRTETVGQAGELMADGRRIGQVLINLILNASNFAPDGTTIGLTISYEPTRVRIQVTDRGPGVRPEHVARLFEFYYQASPDLASGKGLGLGLAIVRTIVQAHGGSLGARNRSGPGACFWFELPRVTHPRAGVASVSVSDR